MSADEKSQKAPVKRSKGTAAKPAVSKKPKKVAKRPEKSQPKAVKKSAKKDKAKAKVKDEKRKAEELDEEGADVEIIEEEEEAEEGEGPVYNVKLKPKLTKSEKTLLNVRRRRKDSQPKFRRQEWHRYKRLGDSWRKPRGLHSKMRKNVRYRPPMARIGYGTNKNVRGRHPSGFQEVMVFKPGDLEEVNPKTQAVRIAHQVGTRKRIAIEDKADEMGIRILNRGSV
jgi:large subunit ribosomal protein L32e